MKKTLLIVLFCVLLSPLNSYAQASMRDMAVTQLYQYGQSVYDRGDYAQAAAIFSRVLAIDPSHQGARTIAQALNNKGERIDIPAKPQQVITVPQKVEAKIPEHNVPQTINPISHSSDDLQKQIQEADTAINQLRTQVAQLRTQLSQGQP